MPRPTLRNYVSTYGRLILFAIVLVAALIGYLVWQDHEAQRSYQKVAATITGFGTSKSKWQPGKVWVDAQTSDGIVGEAFVPADQIRGCKIGDEISAERLGIVLKLTPAPCEDNLN